MAKMKFYLNIEGAKLRTLDDLRENFFADGVLAHYQSGKLAQWLDVWNYKDELEQVRAIQAKDTRGILAELCRIFDVEAEADLEDFETDVSPEDYLTEKKEAAAQAEIQERIKAATSEVNMEFFEDWIDDDKDGSQRKKLNAWLSLFPPLMVAITHGDEFVVKNLIQRGADVKAIVDDENYNCSVLRLAVQGDSPEIVQALIDAGADVNDKAKSGRTALMLAVNKPEIAKILIKARAYVNAKDELFGSTVLMRAVRSGNVETVRALIQAGADVNAKDDMGDTVLMETDKPEVIKILANAGANVNAKDSTGWTVLMRAEKPEVVKTLVAAGADVNAKEDNGGNTVLIHAVVVEHDLDVIKALIEAGADVNDKDEVTGSTALMKTDNPEVIKLLVRAGANINAVDDLGQTALMKASISTRMSVSDFNQRFFEFARESGSSTEEINGMMKVIKEINEKMESPKKVDSTEVIKTLIELGANVNAKDILGRTALDKAEDDRIKAILKAAGAR